MKQAIAGVTPADSEEVTVMVVWPSIARYWLGRQLGHFFSIKAGFYVFTVGNLFALASIPVCLALYFYRLTPSVVGLPLHGSFYRLTNRRVQELRNEIDFAPGPRWMRTFPATGILILGVVTLIVYMVIFGGIIPTSLPGLVFAALGVLAIVAGAWPLIQEANGRPVPTPRFTYGVETKSVELDRFDTIEVVQLPGQAWFAAGDLVFSRGGTETFRLDGVSRPETFRQTCLKSHLGYVGVKQALARETVPA